MDKGLLLLDEISLWQENEITILLVKGIEEILQTIREGYVGCNDDQFKQQKGREIQTIQLLDLIQRAPEMWLGTDAVKRPQSTVKGEITHESIETAT
jgi:hypothetical protein